MDETNKSSFDFSNLGGLLFGGDDSGLGEYLSPTQQKAMQNQALMSAAMSLLKNSGYTTQPVSLGQALGSAYEAGKTGYQGAQENAIKQMLTKQKLDEARRAQSSLDAYQKFITGIPVEGQAITPEQAISAPGMAIGPTVERANLIGQPISGATMPSAGTPLTPQMQRLLSFLPPEKGIPEAIKMMQPQKTTGQPFRAADGKFYVMTETGGVVPAPVAPEAKPTGQPQEVMVGGKPALVQYYEDGSYKVVSGVTPKIKTTGQPFKGVDEKYYIQTETGDVIPAPVAPAPEITGEAFKGADGNYYYMTKQGPIPASVAPAPEITGQAFKGADGKFYYPTKLGPIPAEIAPADLAAEEFGAAVPEVVDGKTQMVQYNKYGQRRVVPGAMPYEKPEATPDEVRLLKAANKEITMENIMALRQSSATRVDVRQNAEKKGLELGYELAVKDLGVSRDMARSANTTLANIDRILPALDTAITGPAADFRATLLRVGKQLNVAGADADQVLKNTATVVQGLAQQELAAAEQMRGQGALTDAERAILRRAAGGDVSLTAGELRVGLLAAQRTARMRAESHGQLLSTAVKAIPSLSQIAPMYEVPVYGAQPTNPLQNAIQKEIDRRKASGGKR